MPVRPKVSTSQFRHQHYCQSVDTRKKEAADPISDPLLCFWLPAPSRMTGAIVTAITLRL